MYLAPRFPILLWLRSKVLNWFVGCSGSFGLSLLLRGDCIFEFTAATERSFLTPELVKSLNERSNY